MNHETIDNNESSVRVYSRIFPATFGRAIGSLIYDIDNREYIDFFSGAGGLNYGHNQPVLKSAMIEYLQRDGIIHGLDMATEAKIEFIDVFQKYILQPRNLNYRFQFTGPTGTNAVEAALKLARLVTKRTQVVAFTNAFHGASLGALATTADAWVRNAAGVELSNVTFIPYEGYVEGLDSIKYLQKLLDDSSSGLDTPAAVIVEAIQGEGGVNVASVAWLQNLRQLTSDRGILLIIDDIQAGCGRSGDFFSFEEAGIVPDLITLSKSLSASGLPMALLLIKPEYDIWKPGQHNGTFRGNNLAFVSASHAIKEFWTDDTFSTDVKRKGGVIRDRLSSIAGSSGVLNISVRGRGMFYGLVFNNESKQAKQVTEYAFSKRLIIELSGSHNKVLKLLPALTINDNTLIRGLDIIRDGVMSLENPT
ncbi:MAG: diaminobutyrate--2-oxoglutarate transaminase [Candidatus Uhrbacteria bacterium]|nr:diaminobutyrate--2-oxoglutarate transaminase [Candidatus Uhrbacteria bacterium]